MSQDGKTKPEETASETAPSTGEPAPSAEAKPAAPEGARQLKDVDLDDLEPVEISSFA